MFTFAKDLPTSKYEVDIDFEKDTQCIILEFNPIEKGNDFATPEAHYFFKDYSDMPDKKFQKRIKKLDKFVKAKLNHKHGLDVQPYHILGYSNMTIYNMGDRSGLAYKGCEKVFKKIIKFFEE